MAAGAMMLVVGQEPGQIAQPRVGPRGALAPAVAGRAHDRTGIQEGGPAEGRANPIPIEPPEGE